MSQRLINLSPDLKRLRDEGYDVEVRSGYLVLWDVPYVNARREIKLGALVSNLDLSNDRTVRPGNHVVQFSGDHPCNKDGSEIAQIKHGSPVQKIDDELTTYHSFSNKPAEGYADYHHKMTRYIEIISNPAKAIDPNVTAQTHPVIETEEDDDSPFNYIDTASSRADIVPVMQKLKLAKIAIIGLGGTGSYVLDLVAKTPVKEIHLYDGDRFLQHNAFRTPGAPSRAELGRKFKKVGYLRGRYAKMHRGIVAHPYHLTVESTGELRDMSFVFICTDGGENKRHIIAKLEELDIPFVDTGMGLHVVDDSLIGQVRLTTSTAEKREHIPARIGFGNEEDDVYAKNIQIADLNALNAALAVIKWKKLFGFYKDPEKEHNTIYDLDGNVMHNDEKL